jgi:hypothetical protein
MTIFPKSARQLFPTSSVKKTSLCNKARRRWLCVLARRMTSAFGHSRSRTAWQKLDDHCHRSQSKAPEFGCMKEPTSDQSEDQHESTYALLVRSEEKSRNLLEMVIYPLLIIGAVIAIWQFVLQPMNLPSLDANAALSVTSERNSRVVIL